MKILEILNMSSKTQNLGNKRVVILSQKTGHIAEIKRERQNPLYSCLNFLVVGSLALKSPKI
jgi:hypothetical protein